MASPKSRPTLPESELRMRSIVDHLIDGIVTVDEHGTVETYNPAAERIFGYPAAEVLGNSVRTLMADPDPAGGGDLADYLRSGDGVPRELSMRRKDGSVFPMDLAVSAFQLGRRRYFTGLVRDISERKRAGEELRQAVEELSRSNRDLEQFAYVASHDLQEPLRAVAGCVQVIRKRYRGQLDARGDELIDHAVEGVARMRHLIDDLLAFSRVESSGKTFAAADCGAALAEALANLRVAIDEAGVAVTFDPMPTAVVDSVQMVQLFQNLVGNAVKFRGPDWPAVHVGARREAGGWAFAVRDNGIGIDPAYFARVFVIFQRLHTRAEYPGTGIGLALCQKIVERRGGVLSVESSPGRGSTFTFTLPDRDEGV